jgi:UDP-N-acetylmuramoyl-tripeptide--D-alanyl-D-alanine ligase
VILNIGPAHLETFGSLENVAKAKFELLDRLPEDKPAFLNLDDPFLRKRASQEKHKVVSFALQTKADYQALDLLISGNGHIDFKVRHNLVRLNLLGRHNVYNALATYAVAESFGLSHQEIAQVLENYKPAHLRMEILETGGVKLINDSYNANPASVLAALESLMQTKTTGRRIAVLGDMLELGNEAKKLHEEIGKKAAESELDYLLTVGVLAEFIARSAEVNGFSKKKVKSFDNNQAAIEHLLEILKPGDTVLLKGSRRMRLEEIAEKLQLGMRSRD